MASYQDIDVRLARLERKLDWIGDQFKITKMEANILDPLSPPKSSTLTLNQLYREVITGVIEVKQIDQDTDNGTV